MGIKILGTGSYLPPLSVTNVDMETCVDTSDEWIYTRTGIRSRHFVEEDTNLSLAYAAAKRAIDAANIEREQIGVVVAATITSDYFTPSLACMLQRDLGLPEEILAFDLGAACSGFVYGLQVAHALLADAPGKVALVLGCEVLSKITNFEDRSTCVLFGDGAGAAIVSREDQAPYFFHSGAKGDSETLYCPGPSIKPNPFVKREAVEDSSYVRMDGAEVFRFAVESFCKSTGHILEQANLQATDIDFYVCHQANERIIKAAAKKLNVPLEKFFMNIDHCGNTSAASVPIAFDELARSGQLFDGAKLVLSGFGGGLTYGAAYFIW